jgi:hypothetical protein
MFSASSNNLPRPNVNKDLSVYPQNMISQNGQGLILLDPHSSSGEEAEQENIPPNVNSTIIHTPQTSFKKHKIKKDPKHSSSLGDQQAQSIYFDKRVILYKTEMCRAFTETGYCKYGFQCQFAHYGEELRPVMRHPRYKTDICKTWWKSGGNCPYGRRCCFIHDETPEELASMRNHHHLQRTNRQDIDTPSSSLNSPNRLSGELLSPVGVIGTKGKPRMSFSLDDIVIRPLVTIKSFLSQGILSSDLGLFEEIPPKESEEIKTPSMEEMHQHLPSELQELL